MKLRKRRVRVWREGQVRMVGARREEEMVVGWDWEEGAKF